MKYIKLSKREKIVIYLVMSVCLCATYWGAKIMNQMLSVLVLGVVFALLMKLPLAGRIIYYTYSGITIVGIPSQLLGEPDMAHNRARAYVFMLWSAVACLCTVLSIRFKHWGDGK